MHEPDSVREPDSAHEPGSAHESDNLHEAVADSQSVRLSGCHPFQLKSFAMQTQTQFEAVTQLGSDPSGLFANVCHPTDSSRILLGLMGLSKSLADSSPLRGNQVVSPEVLRGLLTALQYRDQRIVRHSRRVSMLAKGVGEQLGWNPGQLRMLEVAGYLHDIGKIGVPDHILNKPGKLQHSEADLITLYHNIGISVLQACHVHPSVLEVLRHRQTFVNGVTNSFQQFGSEIPLGARILAVADAYDSLSSEQTYRSARKHEEIIKILREGAGKQFDGNVIQALERWLREGRLPGPSEHSTDDILEAVCRQQFDEQDIVLASTINQIFSHLHLLHQLYDGFSLIDSDMRYVVWSNGLEDILGYGASEMLGQSWNTRNPPYFDADGKQPLEQSCPVNRVLESGKQCTADVQIRKKDGAMARLELQCVPLLDNEGRLHGVAEIFRGAHGSGRQTREVQQLLAAATCDPLTSVLNRGQLEAQLTLTLEEVHRHPEEEVFSVIFIDIDHFKKVNDSFGHSVGDTVLKEVAYLLQHELYSGEIVGRYGGEEFVAVCPATDLDTGVNKAERLRLAISRLEIAELKGGSITASFGVAAYEAGDTQETVKHRSDVALYRSKQQGRNRTTSLTVAEYDRLHQGENSEPLEERNFKFEEDFHATSVADVIGLKLGGFIEDHHAKLLDASRKHVRFRLGSKGLFPFWGKTPEKQPVLVDLEMGEAHQTHLNSRNGTVRMPIKVIIAPDGWINDPRRFQDRAKRVFRDIKAYFAVNQ